MKNGGMKARRRENMEKETAKEKAKTEKTEGREKERRQQGLELVEVVQGRQAAYGKRKGKTGGSKMR